MLYPTFHLFKKRIVYYLSSAIQYSFYMLGYDYIFLAICTDSCSRFLKGELSLALLLRLMSLLLLFMEVMRFCMFRPFLSILFVCILGISYMLIFVAFLSFYLHLLTCIHKQPENTSFTLVAHCLSSFLFVSHICQV